ncbi:MAG: hypothetical protein M3N38_06790 [Pseudomonadota bacterium]|nr:hypothetical protein [Pseudomonadota bacterium]
MTLAVLALLSPTAALAEVAATDTASPEITGSVAPAEPPYDQRAFVTRPGSEAIELAARLREGGGLITLPISWRLYRLIGTAAGGEEIFRADEPQANVAVPPGDYRVDIEYGFARFSRLVTLEAERRLSLVFNLNTGAIRVLSRIAVQPPVSGFTTVHRLFALSGQNRARLVAEGARPGEMLRLPAGKYRIESGLSPGNVVAQADVEVKAGVLSAVEVDHQAGIVRLAVADRQAEGDNFIWQVADAKGRIAAEARGASLNVVLSPGHYHVLASAGGTALMSEFSVAAGKSFEVILGR